MSQTDGEPRANVARCERARQAGSFTVAGVFLALAGACGSSSPGSPTAPPVAAAWGQPQRLATIDPGLTESHVIDAKMVIDARGNATAAWNEFGASKIVRASRFRVGTGWSAPVGVGGAPFGGIGLAGDAAGDVLAVWIQGTLELFYARSNAGSGWTAPAPIPNAASNRVDRFDLAMDASGRAWLVVIVADVGSRRMWLQPFSVADGRGPARPLVTLAAGDAYYPRVVLNAAGEGVLAWDADSFLASRFAPGSGWSSPDEVARPSFPAEPAIPLLDAQGNARFLWWEWADGRSLVQGRQWRSDGRWDPTETLVQGFGLWQFSMSPDGHVVVCMTGPRAEPVWAKSYAPSSGWAVPEPLGPGPLEQIDSSVGAGGVAHVVWIRTGSDRVWSRRYDAGRGWAPAVAIDREVASPAPCADGRSPRALFNLMVRTDAVGNALAVWTEVECGVASIWSNRYQTAS